MHLLEKKLAKFGIRMGLGRIKRALAGIGHPEKKLRVILVAGTNGKGSVTACLASILRDAGYRVGSYYSPHLLRYNERWQINGTEISNTKMKQYEKWVLRLSEKYLLTFFEALTAIAYQYFADEQCDFAVMEVGMGGRLDATNAAQEEISIITSIGIDHTQHLGKTEAKIAYEKAGILKSGIGIIGTARPAALKKIQSEAKKRKVPLKILNRDFTCRLHETTPKKTTFDYHGAAHHAKLETSLTGSHQAANASLAVAAAEMLGIREAAIRKGLQNAKIRARLETLSSKPFIVVDGAHNVPGIRQLVRNLSLFRYRRLVVLFAAMKDKQWKSMLDVLAPQAFRIIATQPSNPRAEKATTLAQYASKYTVATPIKNVKSALEFAKSKTGKGDLLLICGSLYLAGDILRLF